MLTEQRYEMILKLLEEKKSVTLQELKDTLKTSESTIRRDLTALHQMGRLVKVFGGAVSAEFDYSTEEDVVETRKGLHMAEKRQIAAYAAGFVRPNSLVYIDAGTTTECFVDMLKERTAVFVTNGISHAARLSETGFRVILVGGELKQTTEAVIGHEAILQLQKYNFSMGFFGTNGVTKNEGFTTPDPQEAAVKEWAMKRCRKKYVLCDSSKFGQVSPVTFGSFKDAIIVTEAVPEKWQGEENVIAAESAGDLL